MIRFTQDNKYSIKETKCIECNLFDLSFIRGELETSKCVMVTIQGNSFYCYQEYYADYIKIDFALAQLSQIECLSLQQLWKNRIECIQFDGCNEWVLQLFPLLKKEGINVLVKSEIWEIIGESPDFFYKGCKERKVNVNTTAAILYKEFSFVMEVLQFNRWKIMNEARNTLRQIKANIFTCTLPEFEDLIECSESEKYRNKLELTITNGKLNINDEYVSTAFQEIYGDEWREIRRRCTKDAMQHWLRTIYDVEYYIRNKRMYSHEKNRCYLIGPCIVEGNTCPEGKSFPEYLQKHLDMFFENKYAVIAISVPFYVISNYLKIVKCLAVRSNDIIICIETVSQKCITCYFENWGDVPDFDFLEVFNSRSDTPEWFSNEPGHTSGYANMKLTEYLVGSIKRQINASNDNILLQKGEGYLSIEKENQIKTYLESTDCFSHIEMGKRVGAIIMKCAPITLGHEYLIDYARKHVDYLYIFVVKQNDSCIRFADRLAMLNQCIKKWDNIKVNSFDKFTESSIVMPDFLPKKISYRLERQLNKDNEVDVWQDVEIFARYIASALNISVLFAGKEEAEEDANGENIDIKRTLEDYGIELEDIAKMKIDDTVINTSDVRMLISQSQWEKVRRFVSEDIYKCLKQQSEIG